MTERPIFNHQDVVNLVKSFAGSGDLRLRANGIQALAVLAAGQERELAATAEPELINAIVSAPSTSDAEIMNGFRDRVLAALRGLGQDGARRMLERLREEHGETKDPARRTALGWLLLRALGSGMTLQISWFGLRRLMRSTGVVKIWPVLGLCAATVVLALCVVLGVVAATGLSVTKGPDAEWFLLPIGWMLLSALTYLTPIGRLDIPPSVRAVEVAIWAVVFAVLSFAGAALTLPDDFYAAPWTTQAAIVLTGALVGSCIRLYRWEAQTYWAWDALSAIVIATSGCMVAAYLGVERKLIGASWVALAPAGAIGAALTYWIEAKGPDVMAKNRQGVLKARSLIWAAAAVILILGSMHIVKIVARFSPLLAVMESGLFEQDIAIPRTIDLPPKTGGTYTITVRPKNDQIDVCFVVRDKNNSTKKIGDEQPKGGNKEATLILAPGTHIEVKAMQNGNCSYVEEKPELVAHAGEFLSGAETVPLSVTITIKPVKTTGAPSTGPIPTK